MRKLVPLVLLLLATPAAAQKITIDYAKDFDFSTVKTFEYMDTKDTNVKDPLMANRIVSALKAQLKASGLEEVTENPDIYVTYHLATKEDKVLTTTGFGYGGLGWGWGAWGGGMASATTTETTFTEGTLIVDAYHGDDKEMIWRGTGTVTVATQPQKQAKQIEKIFTKMASKWKQMLQLQEKK